MTSQSWISPGEYSFIVPAGVHQIDFDLKGAGGGGSGFSPSFRGGHGARLLGTLNVQPGDNVTIRVAGRGFLYSWQNGGAGGYNGGGAGGSGVNTQGYQFGGSGGGGSTEIWLNGLLVAVAAGGGGCGGYQGPTRGNGGNGGGTGSWGAEGQSGADGNVLSGSITPPKGGGGGRWTAGGSGGSASSWSSNHGLNGSYRQGGKGGSSSISVDYGYCGGGGGGGYYGGGGGGFGAHGAGYSASGAAGGGGSCYWNTSYVTNQQLLIGQGGQGGGYLAHGSDGSGSVTYTITTVTKSSSDIAVCLDEHTIPSEEGFIFESHDFGQAYDDRLYDDLKYDDWHYDGAHFIQVVIQSSDNPSYDDLLEFDNANGYDGLPVFIEEELPIEGSGVGENPYIWPIASPMQETISYVETESIDFVPVDNIEYSFSENLVVNITSQDFINLTEEEISIYYDDFGLSWDFFSINESQYLYVEADDSINESVVDLHVDLGSSDQPESSLNSLSNLNPWAYWRLDETSGSVAYDSSGNNRHGNVGSNVDLSAEGGYISTKTGAGMDRPSGSSKGSIHLPDVNFKPLMNGNNSFSVHVLFKLYSMPVIASSNWTEAGTLFAPLKDADFLITLANGVAYNRFSINTQQPNWGNRGSTPVLQINTWYALVVTYNPATGWKMYLDSNLVASSSTTGSIVNTGSFANTIGSSSSGTNRTIDGDVDEVCVFDFELSASQIEDLYASLDVLPSSIQENELINDLNVVASDSGDWYSEQSINSALSSEENFESYLWSYLFVFNDSEDSAEVSEVTETITEIIPVSSEDFIEVSETETITEVIFILSEDFIEILETEDFITDESVSDIESLNVEESEFLNKGNQLESSEIGLIAENELIHFSAFDSLINEYDWSLLIENLDWLSAVDQHLYINVNTNETWFVSFVENIDLNDQDSITSIEGFSNSLPSEDFLESVDSQGIISYSLDSCFVVEEQFIESILEDKDDSEYSESWNIDLWAHEYCIGNEALSEVSFSVLDWFNEEYQSYEVEFSNEDDYSPTEGNPIIEFIDFSYGYAEDLNPSLGIFYLDFIDVNLTEVQYVALDLTEVVNYSLFESIQPLGSYRVLQKFVIKHIKINVEVKEIPQILSLRALPIEPERKEMGQTVSAYGRSVSTEQPHEVLDPI